MARTVSIQRTITYRDGANTLPGVPVYAEEITQTTPKQAIIPVTVTTTEIEIDLTDYGIATNGKVMIRNRSTANYIEVGSATGEYLIRAEAGGTEGPFQLNASKVLKLKANTASCETEIYAWAK